MGYTAAVESKIGVCVRVLHQLTGLVTELFMEKKFVHEIEREELKVEVLSFVL